MQQNHGLWNWPKDWNIRNKSTNLTFFSFFSNTYQPGVAVVMRNEQRPEYTKQVHLAFLFPSSSILLSFPFPSNPYPTRLPVLCWCEKKGSRYNTTRYLSFPFPLSSSVRCVVFTCVIIIRTFSVCRHFLYLLFFPPHYPFSKSFLSYPSSLSFICPSTFCFPYPFLSYPFLCFSYPSPFILSLFFFSMFHLSYPSPLSFFIFPFTSCFLILSSVSLSYPSVPLFSLYFTCRAFPSLPLYPALSSTSCFNVLPCQHLSCHVLVSQP